MDASLTQKTDLLPSPEFVPPPTTLEVLRSTVHRALSTTLGISKDTCEHVEAVVVTRLDAVRSKLEDVAHRIGSSELYKGASYESLSESLRATITQIQDASVKVTARGEAALDRMTFVSDAKAGLERASTTLSSVRRVAVERSTAATSAATASIHQSVTAARASISEAVSALGSFTDLPTRAFSNAESSARAAVAASTTAISPIVAASTTALSPLVALPTRAISSAHASARAAVAASSSAISALPTRALSTADSAARTAVQTAATLTVQAEAIDTKVTGGRGRSLVDYTLNLVSPAVDYLSGLRTEFHDTRSSASVAAH